MWTISVFPLVPLSARAQGYGTKARVMIFVSFFWSMAFLLGKLSMGGWKIWERIQILAIPSVLWQLFENIGETWIWISSLLVGCTSGLILGSGLVDHHGDNREPKKIQNGCRCLLIYSPNSSWAEWCSQFLLETAFVPSWFTGSTWFRLGFRCLSPFFFRLAFLRTGVLFHHGLLVPLGSGWGSGACLPSSLFFLSQERGSVPLWFAGSSWFRLGFRCLSPFFSLLSFLRKRVLFHHDLLVPLGSGWGSGACLPSSLFFGSGAYLPSSLFFFFSGKGFCSIMICWFFLVPAGIRVLVSLLLFSLVPVLVSLLLSSFFPQARGSVPSWFAGSGWGSGACIPSSLFFGSGAYLPSSLFLFSSGKGFCSIMICSFLLVPAGVPVLVALLLFSLVPVLVPLLLSSFFPQEKGSVPSWFAGSSWFRLGFRCLSPFFSLLWFRCLSPFFSLLFFLGKGVLFHHDFLVPSGSGWGSGACLPSSLFFLSFSSGRGFCSIMIGWFLLLPAGRYCSQEKRACTSFGLDWKLRTSASTLCGFLDASGRLFYCLVFVRLK